MTLEKYTANNNQVIDAQKVLSNMLQEKMLWIFDTAIQNRNSYYSQNPDKIPNSGSLDEIVNYYSLLNAGISGALNLVPGPLGIIAVAPEIAAATINQVSMVYDIGMAHGKGKSLDRELLLPLFIFATGATAGSLITMHGNRILIKRASLRVLQHTTSLLAGQITQRALKSYVAKWVPICGAAAIAIWSSYMTRQIGHNAIDLFNKDIVFEASPSNEESNPSEKCRNDPDPSIEKARIRALINLMKMDKKVKQEEIKYILQIIGNSCLSEYDKDCLIKSIHSETMFKIDYSIINASRDDAVGLLEHAQ